MNFIVYKISNSINGFIYIGATTQILEKRFYQHISSKRYNHLLYREMILHGKEKFTIQEIERCSSEKEMLERETYWIEFYKSNKDIKIYNLIRSVHIPFVPTENHLAISAEIKSHFSMNQSLLAKKIGMSEAVLSRKINDIIDFTQEDLDKINKVLGTEFKL